MGKPYLFPNGARLGDDNLVLNARGRRHRVEEYPGPLSIKTVLHGQVSWWIGGREFVLDSSSFLIIAADEPYSMNIDEPRPVETCCVFFAKGFIERIALDATSPLEDAIEAPGRPAPPLPYLSALHADRERAILERVQSFAPRCRGALAPSGFEEDFFLLANQLLGYYDNIREQMARVPAARASTREELFRRILRGRDYLHGNASAPVSLHDAARAACLSPFHFHRSFTRAFALTPHAYLTRLRLERARAALERGARAVDACVEAGFSSPSAFGRLFRRNFGELPSAVRRKFARSGKNARPLSGTLPA